MPTLNVDERLTPDVILVMGDLEFSFQTSLGNDDPLTDAVSADVVGNCLSAENDRQTQAAKVSQRFVQSVCVAIRSWDRFCKKTN